MHIKRISNEGCFRASLTEGLASGVVFTVEGGTLAARGKWQSLRPTRGARLVLARPACTRTAPHLISGLGKVGL